MKGEGKRFNEGKTRHDLIPPYAQEQLAKVLTAGMLKYSENNWKMGMSWSKVLASLERHLQAIKVGEDYDKETGLLHSAHVMCNAAFLTEYYKIYPQGDDRWRDWINPKIGIDIDGIIADFSTHYLRWFGLNSTKEPTSWNDPRFRDEQRWRNIESSREFWATIPKLIEPSELPFEPHCYITARSIPQEWTEAWLFDICGFPVAPVYTVGRGQSKVDLAKKAGVEIFVDDHYKNFVELSESGIFTYLMTRSHNLKYDVGHRRISSLKELK